MASMNPRATLNPRPTPRAVPRSSTRPNGWNIRSRWASVTPGPWSTTFRLAVVPARGRAHLDRPVLAAVADRVVEQVREHTLEQTGVRLDEREILRHVDRHPLRCAWDGQHGCADRLVERDRPDWTLRAPA